MALDFDKDNIEDDVNIDVHFIRMCSDISQRLSEVYDKRDICFFRYYLGIAPIYFANTCPNSEKKKEIMERFPVPVTSIPSISKCDNRIEEWKRVDEEMKKEWEKENSQFKANMLNAVTEYFEEIEVRLEDALNTARNTRMLPEFAYYTALKWAFMKEKGLTFLDYILLLNMPIKEFVSVKELYERLKVMLDILLMPYGNVSASLNNSLGVSVEKLLDQAITELIKFQYDVK